MIDPKHMGKSVTYDSLHQSARHYRGERNYCSVIAVAVSAGIKFGKARSLFERHGRTTGWGTYQPQQEAALAECGLRMERERDLSFFCSGTHLCLVTKRLPNKGTFLVYTCGHVSVVKDGILEDWSARKGRGARKRIISIYRVV